MNRVLCLFSFPGDFYEPGYKDDRCGCSYHRKRYCRIAGGGFFFATDALSVEAHIEKTLESGRLLNDRKLVKFFATLAPSKFDSRMQLEYFIVNNPGQSKIPRGGENQVFDVGIKDVCL